MKGEGKNLEGSLPQLSSTQIEEMGYRWFMRNALPRGQISDGCYLYNLDDQGSRGTHWTMFCLKRPDLYYVDSFGTDLNGYPPQELRDWGRKQGAKMIYANEWDF